jgi:hypothetical protein
MRAMADIALLVGTSDVAFMPKQTARASLAKMVDLFHKQYPDSLLSVHGKGVLGFTPERAHVLQDLKNAAAKKEKDDKLQAQLLLDKEQDRIAAEKIAMDLQQARLLAKAKAVVGRQTADALRWNTLEAMDVKYRVDDAAMMAKCGLHAPGWLVKHYPTNRTVCIHTHARRHTHITVLFQLLQ